MAFEQTFKNIDNILRTDEGCGSELDYIEQKSWILFLKYLDDLEKTRRVEAELQDKTYTPVIAEGYRWNDWAMPRTAKGEYDVHNALVGDDLIEFVNNKLFPYLKRFTSSTNTGIESKIGVVFGEIRNRIASGYNLRDVLEQVDGLKFQTTEQKHELTYLYESSLNKMGNAGRNGGEYYTPRPLIRTIVRVVNPEIGKTVYDGACGSAGFLCEAYNYMHSNVKKTADERTLQTSTFYGKEVKGLAYIIGMMNMILHGVECPNITRTNTLTENLADVQEKDRFDYIVANPPFGGKERAEVQQNFPIKTSETAYLFLQHFIKYLRAGGSAGIVIKNTFLSNTDNASVALRKKLLEDCNLHTILDLPSGVFQAGVKTIVLFFKKGEPTKKVWFYQLNLDRTLGKTDPLNENDLADFVEKQKTKADSENSWSINVADLNDQCDLSVKNPNRIEVVDERTPEQIAVEISAMADKSREDLQRAIELYQEALKKAFEPKERWQIKKLGEVCRFQNGFAFKSNLFTKSGEPIIRISDIQNEEVCENNLVYFNLSAYKEDLSRFIVYPNDILIAMSGGTTGKLGINKTNKRFYLNQRVGVFREDKNVLDHYYLFYYLHTKSDESLRIAAGAAQPNLSTAQVNAFEIPIPPLSEQRRIVTLLEAEFAKINVMKANAEQTSILCDDLKQALLRKAFNGEI